MVGRPVASRRFANLVDRPSVAGAKERGEVAFALLLLRVVDLLRQLVVVDGTLDGTEDAERRRVPLRERQARHGERERRVVAVRVPDERVTLAVEHFGAAVGAEP